MKTIVLNFKTIKDDKKEKLYNEIKLIKQRGFYIDFSSIDNDLHISMKDKKAEELLSIFFERERKMDKEALLG